MAQGLRLPQQVGRVLAHVLARVWGRLARWGHRKRGWECRVTVCAAPAARAHVGLGVWALGAAPALPCGYGRWARDRGSRVAARSCTALRPLCASRCLLAVC